MPLKPTTLLRASSLLVFLASSPLLSQVNTLKLAGALSGKAVVPFVDVGFVGMSVEAVNVGLAVETIIAPSGQETFAVSAGGGREKAPATVKMFDKGQVFRVFDVIPIEDHLELRLLPLKPQDQRGMVRIMLGTSGRNG